MKAIRRHLDAFHVEQIERPVAKRGETLVRVVLAGVCRTDLYAARGEIDVTAPVTLGHEFCGQVETSALFPEGTYVTSAPFFSCGACFGCRNDQRCVDLKMIGLHRDGAFAEFVVVPDQLLFEVPESIDPRRAAYVEPVAAALAPIRSIARGKPGYVLGTGRIASLTREVLSALGYESVHYGDGSSCETGSIDWVIETRATEATLATACRLLRIGGTLVLKSRPAEPVLFDVGLAVRRNLKIEAVHYGSFEQAIELLSSGALSVDDIFGDHYTLEQAEVVFAAADRETKKVFFEIGDW